MFIGQRSTTVNLVIMIKMIDLLNLSWTTMLIQRMVIGQPDNYDDCNIGVLSKEIKIFW